MSDDPYSPPNAPVRDRKPEAVGSTWKAVTFGVLADIGATFLVSVLLYMMLGSMLVSRGASPDDLDANLMSSQVYLMLSAAVGLGCTGLGGYVAARVANGRGSCGPAATRRRSARPRPRVRAHRRTSRPAPAGGPRRSGPAP